MAAVHFTTIPREPNTAYEVNHLHLLADCMQNLPEKKKSETLQQSTRKN